MSELEILKNLDSIIDDAESNDKYIPLIRHIRDSMLLSIALTDDMTEAAKLFKNSNTEFANRTFIRTMSAEFEARLYLLQQTLLSLESLESDLTSYERMLLKGESAQIQGNGKLGVVKKNYTFKETLLFTLNTAKKHLGDHVFCDNNDPKWQDVLKFIQIRNRLFHPKSVSDLDISDTEIDSLNRPRLATRCVQKCFQF
jgi:hypothetical protein